MNYRKMKRRQRKDRRKEKERRRRGIKSTCLHVTDVEQSDLSEQPVINPFILLIAALINHRLTVKKHNVIFLMSEQLGHLQSSLLGLVSNRRTRRSRQHMLPCSSGGFFEYVQKPVTAFNIYNKSDCKKMDNIRAPESAAQTSLSPLLAGCSTDQRPLPLHDGR